MGWKNNLLHNKYLRLSCKKKTKMSTEAEIAALKKKRTFKKFSFRGVDLDQLLDLSAEQLMELVHCRARRRFTRGLKMKPLALIKKLRKAKKEAPVMEKPAVVKTHLRDMIGSIVGVHKKLSTKSKSSLKWLATILVNSPS